MHNDLKYNLLPRDLSLSFADARAQYEHFEQQEALHVTLYKCLLSGFCSRPTVWSGALLHSNCHLKDCWPLAGREE